MAYPQNIIGFDMSNDIEAKAHRFLVSLGRARNRVLKMLLFDAYPNSVVFEKLTTRKGKEGIEVPYEDQEKCRTIIVNPKLVSLIDGFNSKNIPRLADKEISVSWAYDDEIGLQCCVILSALNKGTAGKFLAEQLAELLTPKMFDVVIPNMNYEETANKKKKSPASVQKVVPTPIVQTSVEEEDEPVSFTTEKKKYSEEEIMKKLEQAEAEANAEDEEDEPVTEPVVKMPIDPMIEAGLHLFDDTDSEPTDESEIPFR